MWCDGSGARWSERDERKVAGVVKVEIITSVEVSADNGSDGEIWTIFQQIEMPAAPSIAMIIRFEPDDSARMVSELEVSSVVWNVPEQQYDVFIKRDTMEACAVLINLTAWELSTYDDVERELIAEGWTVVDKLTG